MNTRQRQLNQAELEPFDDDQEDLEANAQYAEELKASLQRQKGGGHRSPSPAALAVVQSMTMQEKLKYAAMIGIPVGVLGDLVSSSGGMALLTLLLAGSVTYHFAPSWFKQKMVDGLPVPREARGSTMDRLIWLVTGQSPADRGQAQLPAPARQPLTQYGNVAQEEQDDEPEVVEVIMPQQRSAPSYQFLNMGDLLRPHANLILSNRMAILGMPNAGKTNTISVIMEELGRLGVPLLLFDTKPEYQKLCQRPYFVNPFPAGADNITVNNAHEFGRQIMDERLQVVLDLTSYRDSDVAAMIMIEVLDGIWEWEAERKNEDREPVMIGLDEVHTWLPQQQNLTDVSKAKIDGGDSLFTRLQKAFFQLVKLGRSYGMGWIASSQRPQDVDKRVISPCEWKLLLKVNDPPDIEVYEKYGFSGDEARKLERGEAYIIGPAQYSEGTIYQIRKRKSPDESKTPGIENLRRRSSTTIVQPEEELPQILSLRDRLHFTGPIRAPLNDPRVYGKGGPQIYPERNENAPLNGSFNPVINGSTSDATTIQHDPNLHLMATQNEDRVERGERGESPLNVNVNLETPGKIDTSKVDASKREMIKRLAEMGIATHAQIAKAAKLDGPKYPIYKQVCAEEGIEIK